MRFVDDSKEVPEEVDFVYVGQYSPFSLEVKLGYNVSQWSLEIENNTLLSDFINDRYIEFVEAGYWGFFSINIDPEADVGLHNITFHLNYTKTSGEEVHKQFHLQIELIRPLEITELKLPSGRERDFTVSIRTFVHISDLTVKFGGDGNVEVDDESISMNEISPGNYTFETKIHFGRFDATDGQELSYHIIGQADDRTFEYMEYNIPADIDWTVGETKDSFVDWLIFMVNGEFLREDDGKNELDWYMVIFWVLVLSIIIGSIVLFILKARSKKKKSFS